ncbi:hypothetical protein [Corallococcus exercitus]|uniref:hypothetical protein n=1 Tax=Corallococcus exercitus TaxID=2316736 RepID=UPI0035D49D5E
MRGFVRAGAVLLSALIGSACGQPEREQGTRQELGSLESTLRIEPAWERTTGYFIEEVPYFRYYGDDDRDETWTSNAWDGRSQDVQGRQIPGHIPGDTWFYTPDLGQGQVGADGYLKGTYYWFRTQVELTNVAALKSLKLEDKFRPGRVVMNDGYVVFVNGIPVVGLLPGVTKSLVTGGDPLHGTSIVQDASLPTEWSSEAFPIPLYKLREGTNEIAVLFEERYGGGGLGHLVLDAQY